MHVVTSGREWMWDSTNWFRIFRSTKFMHFPMVWSFSILAAVSSMYCGGRHKNVRQITDFDLTVSLCICVRWNGLVYALMVAAVHIIFRISVFTSIIIIWNYHKGSESTNARFVCSRVKTSIIIFVAYLPTLLKLGTLWATMLAHSLSI